MERRYSLKTSRIKNSHYKNIKIYEDGSFGRLKDNKDAVILIQEIDGAKNDNQWGRFFMEMKKDVSVVYSVHIFAMNKTEFLRKGTKVKVSEFLMDESVDKEIKDNFLNQVGQVVKINKSDILLYSLKGRYLWIYIRFRKAGSFNCSNMRVDVVGDNFMETFPEVYRERNSFFHRYLSVFSSIYNDFQEKINTATDILDINKAPVELFEIYAGWFGIDFKGGFMTEEKIRLFMSEIYDLVKKKGTMECLEGVAEIILGEKPVIIERNQVHKEKDIEKQRIIDELYGNSMYDVLVLTTIDINEDKKAQLVYFLEQFTPIRCNMNVIFLKDYGNMDRYTYLGVNAVLRDETAGVLDDDNELDQMIYLQ